MSLIQCPEELLLNIFSRLKITDLQHLLSVCTKTKRIAENEQLREKIFIRDFPVRKQIKAIVIKTLLEKKNIQLPANVRLENLSWKDQYRYAYQIATNLREQTCKQEYYVGGHNRSINCLKSMGRYIFSGSEDGIVVIRDLHDSAKNRILRSDQGFFSVNGNYLVLIQNDSLFVMSSDDGYSNILQSLRCGGNALRGFQLIGDYLFANNFQKTLKIWKIDCDRNFIEILSIEGVRKFYCTKKYLFTINMDSTISIWKKNEKGMFDPAQTIEDPSPSKWTSFSAHYSDGTLITLSSDGGIKSWKVDENGRFVKLQTIKPIDLAFPVSCYVAKGNLIILGFVNGCLRILKKNKNGLFAQIQYDGRHTTRIEDIQLKGANLITGCLDGTAIVWEKTKEGKFREICMLGTKGEAITTCVEAYDGYFSVGYSNGTIRTWDFTDGISL
jgi:WD40 repeat protein